MSKSCSAICLISDSYNIRGLKRSPTIMKRMGFQSHFATDDVHKKQRILHTLPYSILWKKCQLENLYWLLQLFSLIKNLLILSFEVRNCAHICYCTIFPFLAHFVVCTAASSVSNRDVKIRVHSQYYRPIPALAESLL